MGKLDYTTKEINDLLGKVKNGETVKVPEWAMQASKPKYTAEEVGALPATTPVLPDAPDDGKTYGRKNGRWAEMSGSGSDNIVEIPGAVMALSPDNTSDEIFAAWGGKAVMYALIQKMRETGNLTIVRLVAENSVVLSTFDMFTTNVTDENNFSVALSTLDENRNTLIFTITGGNASFQRGTTVLLTSESVENNLTSTFTDKPLSAAMGKKLNDEKQALLLSGTNIKTINGTSLLGSGNIEIEGGGDTPETSNIISHTHDRMIGIRDFEMDIWDGVSVSESLEGGGTKDNPYLIKSCADFLHINLNTSKYNANVNFENEPTGYISYFRIEKNLDFGNHNVVYPVIDVDGGGGTEEEMLSKILTLAVIDGQGITIERFSSNNSSSVFSNLYLSLVRGINIRSSSFVYDVKNAGYGMPIAPLLGNYAPIYSSNADCSCEARIDIIGVENDTENTKITLSFAGISMYSTFGNYQPGKWYGKNTFVCNNNPSNKPIIIQYIPVFLPDSRMGEATSSMTLCEYSPVELLPADGNSLPGLHVYMFLMEGFKGKTYYNSEVIGGISVEVGVPAPIPKTTVEMKSPEFLAVLNSASVEWVADVDNINYGYPIFAPKERILYDGYVRQSEFPTLMNSSSAHLFWSELFSDGGILSSTRIKNALDKQGGFDSLYDKVKNAGKIFIEKNLTQAISQYSGTITMELVSSVLKEDSDLKQIGIVYIDTTGPKSLLLSQNRETGNLSVYDNIIIGRKQFGTNTAFPADKILINDIAVKGLVAVYACVGEPVKFSKAVGANIQFKVGESIYTDDLIYVIPIDFNYTGIRITLKEGDLYEVYFDGGSVRKVVVVE